MSVFLASNAVNRVGMDQFFFLGNRMEPNSGYIPTLYTYSKSNLYQAFHLKTCARN